MTSLLRVLREHHDAVEADLSRYHHIDIRDRWRRNADGSRKLTLRMIAVRMRHFPPQSATALALGGDGLAVRDVLLMDVWQAAAQSKKPHPMRPRSRGKAPVTASERRQRARAVTKARQRAVERRQAIDSGEIT